MKKRACLRHVTRLLLLGTALASGIGVAQTAAWGAVAQEAPKRVRFNIPAQPLAGALTEYARQSGQQLLYAPELVKGKSSVEIIGEFTPFDGLKRLLTGSGLGFRTAQSGAFILSDLGRPALEESLAATPLGYDATGGQDDSGGDIIVTAQKREERISDVPIAMTALTSKGLDDRKIEGGSELLRAVPNVNFSKSNFSMYNFSIRGVGTKAVSASSDPAVAVSFNNTPLVRNRLFESEFFDMGRVEVLRGPQGTLYGRNATAGVVNLIPALPEQDFAGEIKGELGSFDSKRASGMLNIPIADTLGFRVAGAWTKRDGFDYNTFTEQRVNGRNLWSTRAILQWQPSDRFKTSLIWQHFEEDDNRSRTGKQLCTRDPGPEKVGDVVVATAHLRGKLSQGCLPGSLYDDAAYGVPNAYSLVYLTGPASNISFGRQPNPADPRGRNGPFVYSFIQADPFEGVTQSRNLRKIATEVDPVFRAKNDVVQFNMDFDVADGLQLVSQTAYARDRYHSMQDYNRFVTNALFNNTDQPLLTTLYRPVPNDHLPGPTPGGVYCDPQMGCSDRMKSADISQSRNRQWSQELRLQSSFDGPVNFNIGTNFLDFKSRDNYYIFNNLFTYFAEYFYSREFQGKGLIPCELGDESRECPYVERNPIGSLENLGHNYFLSQNGVRIKSWASFGELYWKAADNLNLTLGLRYTRDRKLSDQVPSQLLLAGGQDLPLKESIGDYTGGRINSGYPALEDIRQSWGKFTGRAVLDWKPHLGFTDETLVYLSAARGYKGGGTNPPRVDFNPNVVQYQPLPQTFKPEYVNSIEIGTKNSFNGGRLMLNANAFLYDYKDYQISQIVDRIAYNENFDAINWGLELEAAWRPSRSFRLDGNLGYLKTRLKKGSQSIDVMNRTQGDPDWVVLRPWIQVPSNCIAPRAYVERLLEQNSGELILTTLCPGAARVGTFNPDPNVPSKFRRHDTYGFTYEPTLPYDPIKVGVIAPYDPANPDAWKDLISGAPNGGRGFYADLTGNELPNAPRVTANVGAQYTVFMDSNAWELTLRGDYYWQAKSFSRIYNTKFDRLRAWDNVNLNLTLSRPAWGLTMQLYVKNLFNDAPITDTFLNSDDTGLTANVFTLDPRIIAFNISKKF